MSADEKCNCGEKVELFPRFGIRAYTYDEPSIGVTLYCMGLGNKKKRYTCVSLDLWKCSFTFGWSLIPETGDGGTQLL